MTEKRFPSSKFVKVQPTKDTRNGKATQVRFRLRREDGSFRETSETFYDNIEGAESFAEDIRRFGSEGALAKLGWQNSPRRVKVEVLTIDQWMVTYIDTLTRAEEQTRLLLHDQRRNYIKPMLGDVPLAELDYELINAWVDMLGKEGQGERRGGRKNSGLAPRTVKHAFVLLSAALNAAIFAEKLTSNPAENVKLPTIYGKPPLALTKAQFVELRDAFPEHYRPLLEFLVTTGVRWGEAVGLHPRDVDVEAGEVFIHQSLVRRHINGKYVYERREHPKTPHSTRYIDAPRGILQKLDLDPAREFVFLNADGLPYHHTEFYGDFWRPTIKKLNFSRKPSIKTFRSTYATWQNAAGVDIKTIQHQLGHSNAATTARFYATRDPLKGKDAVAHFESMFT